MLLIFDFFFSRHQSYFNVIMPFVEEKECHVAPAPYKLFQGQENDNDEHILFLKILTMFSKVCIYIY